MIFQITGREYPVHTLREAKVGRGYERWADEGKVGGWVGEGRVGGWGRGRWVRER